MSADGFMNAEETARYLNLAKNSVYQLAKSGELASYHIGRKLRFTREDADAYLNASHRMPRARQPENETERDDAAELTQAAAFGDCPAAKTIIAGNDAAADTIARALTDSGTPTGRHICESYTALVNLYAGEADAAVIHLYDQSSNTCNIPYVRRLAPGVSVAAIHLYSRYQGLIVKKGNPKKLSSWGALLRNDIRLSNRLKGSGARILLDEKLRALEARSETIDGYNQRASAATVAIHHVARGAADVTIGTAYEMRGIDGVQFVPLQNEWVDIVIRKTPESLNLIRSIEQLLSNDTLRGDFVNLGADDTSKAGCIVFES